MWKSGLGEKLIYSTQKLTKFKKKKDNSVPVIILMLSFVSIRLMKNSRTTLTDFFILYSTNCCT